MTSSWRRIRSRLVIVSPPSVRRSERSSRLYRSPDLLRPKTSHPQVPAPGRASGMASSRPSAAKADSVSKETSSELRTALSGPGKVRARKRNRRKEIRRTRPAAHDAWEGAENRARGQVTDEESRFFRRQDGSQGRKEKIEQILPGGGELRLAAESQDGQPVIVLLAKESPVDQILDPALRRVERAAAAKTATTEKNGGCPKEILQNQNVSR